MRHARLIISLIFLAACVAGSTAVQAFEWGSKNLTLVDTKEEDIKKTVTLKDGNGFQFTLSFAKDPEGAMVDKVLNLKERLFQWKLVKIKTLDFVIAGDRVDVVVYPDSYSYKKNDFLPYLPAGMHMIMVDSLEYNFRINVKNYFIRIKGEFTTEADIADKLLEAIKNPRAYIRKRDPEYILKKLDALEEGLDKLRNDHARLQESHVKLQANHEQLKKAHEGLREENEKMRYAQLTLHNEGFLWGLYKIRKEAIKKVIELKTKNPAMKNEDIQKQLEKDGVKISTKEVFLIISVYFNIFEDIKFRDE